MNTEWLSKLCNPDDIRPVCQKPYSITINSTRWAFAANGLALCAIKSASGYTDYCSESFSGQSATNKFITEVLQHDGDYQIATLDSLRKWVGDPLPYCSACNASGLIACPDGCEFGCAHCNYECSIQCPDCMGESSPYRNPAYGFINDVLINCKLIATAFHHLEEGQVRVMTRGKNNAIYFISSTWRVIVMPIIEGSDLRAEGMEQAVRFNEWSNLANAG